MMEKRCDKGFLEFIKEIIPVKDNQKARVVILISLFRKYEGASVVAEQQAKELLKNGYSVSIFTFETNIDLSNNGIEINIIRPLIRQIYNQIYRGLYFLDVVTMINLIRKLRYFDLIIIHHGNMALLGFIAKKLFRAKVVFWNHHLDEDVPQRLVHRVYRRLFEPIKWRIIKGFDYVVSVSKFSRSQLKAVKRTDSIVIYNKVDERFREGLDGTIIRKKHGLRYEPLLLFVGRLVPRKNVHLLIEVFNLIRKEIPDAKLIIVGRRDDKNYFEKLLNMANESIIFVENVPDEELPLYYAACDAYVTCSQLEGFNLPIAEAQACGKPVIAFDIGPHREIIKKGYAVKPYDVVEFKEKVVEILRNKGYY